MRRRGYNIGKDSDLHVNSIMDSLLRDYLRIDDQDSTNLWFLYYTGPSIQEITYFTRRPFQAAQRIMPEQGILVNAARVLLSVDSSLVK